MRKCTACQAEKENDQFSAGKAMCKTCRTERESRRYWAGRDSSKRRELPRGDRGRIARASVPPTDELARSFWRHVHVDHEGACWAWLGKINKRHRYGYFYVPGTGGHVRAHRFAWALAHGQAVPTGMHVLHSCDNPPCVNPAHLRIGTREDNMRDMVNKGRGNSQKHRRARIEALLPPR